MNTVAFWLNAAIFAVGLIVLYQLFLGIIRKQACFAMYAVRDDLIYLVASGALKEDGPVFRHYYTRVNQLLRAAPNVGLDRLLEAIFTRWEEHDFNEMLRQADAKASILFRDQAFDDQDVRRVVAAYYRALQGLILAHSSVLRLVYLTGFQLAKRLPQAVMRLAPSPYRRALKAVEYADREAGLAEAARLV
ncbi:hypothetical protein [Allochromatium palmeri]|uniref:DUF4760 domain-containing protein n=1 Tax=Allochromatium palmeri TaxID=231048 RepID=A0A6N8EF43_9GAMM|nr:hypothetical protein [Allochromatium palmeri]MTW21157.1 hypothetical protein [Allochromatium palmeri]